MPLPSPFSAAQESEIILQYGKLESGTLVRRWFQRHYKDMIPASRIPNLKQLNRVIERFKKSNTTKHGKSTGRPASKSTPEMIEIVRGLIENDPSLSVSEICVEVDASRSVVHDILKKKLKLTPYRVNNVVPLLPTHKQSRLDFCRWLKLRTVDFADLIIFSDEKKFVEKTRPNRQNERYWSLSDPCIEDENRIQGGKSRMCWAALIDGQVILHWFEEGQTVNQ